MIQKAILSSPHRGLGSLNMNQIPFHLDSTTKAQTLFIGILFHHYNFGHISKHDALQYWLEMAFIIYSLRIQPLAFSAAFIAGIDASGE